MLLDLRAFEGAAQALDATAPVACAKHGGASALIANGRPVVSGGGFWSWAPDEDVWAELAFEGQERFRSDLE